MIMCLLCKRYMIMCLLCWCYMIMCLLCWCYMIMCLLCKRCIIMCLLCKCYMVMCLLCRRYMTVFAGHWSQILECRERCRSQLDVVEGGSYLKEMYSYLQFSYFKSRFNHAD